MKDKITQQTVCTSAVRDMLHETTPDASGSISTHQLTEVAEVVASELGYDYVPGFVTRTVFRVASKMGRVEV